MRGFLKQFAPDVFRPEEISILEDALDDAWRRIEYAKAPWAYGGERDAKWLSDSAVLYLSQQKLTSKAPEAL